MKILYFTLILTNVLISNASSSLYTIEYFREHHVDLLSQKYGEFLYNENFQEFLHEHSDYVKVTLNGYLKYYFNKSGKIKLTEKVGSSKITPLSHYWFFTDCFDKVYSIPELIQILSEIFERKVIPEHLIPVKLDITSIDHYENYSYLWIIHQAFKSCGRTHSDFLACRKHITVSTKMNPRYSSNLYIILDMLFPSELK